LEGKSNIRRRACHDIFYGTLTLLTLTLVNIELQIISSIMAGEYYIEKGLISLSLMSMNIGLKITLSILTLMNITQKRLDIPNFEVSEH